MNVLITGGSGFLGNALVEHLLSHDKAERICIFSRDEFKQSLMRTRFNDPRLRFFIGDVRDKGRLVQAMEGIDSVIHAAALKRIETAHYNPEEVIKTNVTGTMNAIDAAKCSGVRRFLLVSTDKAWQPKSIYGQSKALAESLVLAANNMHGAHGPRFSVVRYGNVAGSTGSVIPTWREMIANGTTVVPCSNPDVTRFWMSADEAVKLVLSALKMMPSNVMVPRLPAYRLGDLAKAMGVDITITGLGEYEKLHEGMLDGNTSDIAPRLSVDDIKRMLKEA